MSMAELVVTAVKVQGRSKSEVARDYGLSRRWVHEIVTRFEAEGEPGLRPRSRRPHTSPHATPRPVEDQVIALRKRLTDQGLDAGAETIAAYLARRTPRSQTSTSQNRPPSVSTIWRILVRRGFVVPQPQKRPHTAWTRFEATQPNERWQADTTHWQLADGTPVEILNIEDDHSRLSLRRDARRTTTADDVVASFRKAFTRYGIPARVLTDNAAVFTARPRGQGRVALEVELGRRRVRQDHSRGNHPQTCGKVERLQQTEKKWLTAQDPARTIEDLQRQLDRFGRHYNHVRPHRALKRKTPAEAYAARPKAVPHGPVIKPHHRVRHDVIDDAGSITLRHDSRLHHIGLGRLLAGTPVTVLTADLDITVIDRATGELLRRLTLDPARDYQPRGARKGPQRPQKRE
jgi:transposase InsO family protein